MSDPRTQMLVYILNMGDILHRTINLGKFGSFRSSELIGQPYGLTYNISEKKLNVVPPRTFQEVGMKISLN